MPWFGCNGLGICMAYKFSEIRPFDYTGCALELRCVPPALDYPVEEAVIRKEAYAGADVSAYIANIKYKHLGPQYCALRHT